MLSCASSNKSKQLVVIISTAIYVHGYKLIPKRFSLVNNLSLHVSVPMVKF